MDFTDAFLTLGLLESERGYVVVTDEKRWFAYTGLPFGVGSAPLTWGRVSALFSRFAQAAMHSDDEARLETYVDDPIIAAAGTPHQRC
eukprot:2490950-Heterocapsa_arctica.AAC.1